MVSSLSDSSVKNRLLSHMTVVVEFKNISDFWSLYSKAMTVMDIAIQEKLDEELLKLAIEIRKILCMVLAYILQAEDNSCLEGIELNCLF